jgi:hypothetical protein
LAADVTNRRTVEAEAVGPIEPERHGGVLQQLLITALTTNKVKNYQINSACGSSPIEFLSVKLRAK